MCPKDGWVVFRNSELLCGRLGKGVLGGNKVSAGRPLRLYLLAVS
jgi:hypothetical protein